MSDILTRESTAQIWDQIALIRSKQGNHCGAILAKNNATDIRSIEDVTRGQIHCEGYRLVLKRLRLQKVGGVQ